MAAYSLGKVPVVPTPGAAPAPAPAAAPAAAPAPAPAPAPAAAAAAATPGEAVADVQLPSPAAADSAISSQESSQSDDPVDDIVQQAITNAKEEQVKSAANFKANRAAAAAHDERQRTQRYGGKRSKRARTRRVRGGDLPGEKEMKVLSVKLKKALLELTLGSKTPREPFMKLITVTGDQEVALRLLPIFTTFINWRAGVLSTRRIFAANEYQKKFAAALFNDIVAEWSSINRVFKIPLVQLDAAAAAEAAAEAAAKAAAEADAKAANESLRKRVQEANAAEQARADVRLGQTEYKIAPAAAPAPAASLTPSVPASPEAAAGLAAQHAALVARPAQPVDQLTRATETPGAAPGAGTGLLAAPAPLLTPQAAYAESERKRAEDLRAADFAAAPERAEAKRAAEAAEQKAAEDEKAAEAAAEAVEVTQRWEAAKPLARAAYAAGQPLPNREWLHLVQGEPANTLAAGDGSTTGDWKQGELISPIREGGKPQEFIDAVYEHLPAAAPAAAPTSLPLPAAPSAELLPIQRPVGHVAPMEMPNVRVPNYGNEVILENADKMINNLQGNPAVEDKPESAATTPLPDSGAADRIANSADAFYQRQLDLAAAERAQTEKITNDQVIAARANLERIQEQNRQLEELLAPSEDPNIGLQNRLDAARRSAVLQGKLKPGDAAVRPPLSASPPPPPVAVKTSTVEFDKQLESLNQQLTNRKAERSHAGLPGTFGYKRKDVEVKELEKRIKQIESLKQTASRGGRRRKTSKKRKTRKPRKSTFRRHRKH
jgi:hypothetical protein